ncbi:hypothetical protein [Haloarchaeobius sp. HRN-SO-5]|uniref:hypothetical protein n=1 Tax=Haloarchaeobius sp. HRN-SO-5 TaxID=3446118 RepID=UPI003EC0BD65
MGFIDRLTGLLGRDDTESTDAPERANAAETTAGASAAESGETGAVTGDGDVESTERTPVGVEPARSGSGGTQAAGATTAAVKQPSPGEREDATVEREAPARTRDRRAVFGEQAAAFVESHPNRELDYSQASLAVLDDVAARETREQKTVLALGSYFGETLLAEHDGAWNRPDGGTWAVVLEGPETDVTLNVFQLASDAVAGPTSFEATYRSVENRL